MTDTTNPTGVHAALTWAEDHSLDDSFTLTDDGQKILIRRRSGEEWQLHDIEKYEPAPNRAVGTIQVHDAESFLAAIDQRRTITPVIYFDEEHTNLVAVLNDDHSDEPGWRDHRVALSLRRTPEWNGWLQGQGLGEQQRFAERIEDGEAEIVTPAASVMLELAQTFHATGNVKFRGGTRLASGARQFVWDETIEASGGLEPGQIAVPEVFTLAVRPFVRSERFEVTARFRYRLRSGELQVGYQLIRPDDIERAAFGQVVDHVRTAATDVVLLAGPAPSAR